MSIEQLGRYRITGKLGEGAMGVVFRAEDTLLERTVAIKTVRFDCSDAEREEFERRFFREAKSAARLNHPAITMVYDAGRVDDIAYIAMELLDGVDLRRALPANGPVDFDRVAEIIAQVADGLHYAHQNGVIHRDIKPANIMILGNGQVKIADFGIAHIQTGAKTMTGLVLGTPKYMSPEQIIGKQVDGRSDIFSLGVVLYQLLTRAAPFDGDTVTTIMYKVLHEPAIQPTALQPGVPEGFEVVLARALAKDPDNRYANAADLAADLRRYKELKRDAAPLWNIGGIGGGDPASLRPGADADFTRIASRPAASAGDPTIPIFARDIPREASAAKTDASPATAASPAKRGYRPLVIAIAAAAVAAVAFLVVKPVAPKVEPAPAVAAAPAARPQNGRMVLAVSPWGEIVVDGKPLGVSPPLDELNLVTGPHQIEIRNSSYEPYLASVEIRAGETLRIQHKFSGKGK